MTRRLLIASGWALVLTAAAGAAPQTSAQWFHLGVQLYYSRPQAGPAVGALRKAVQMTGDFPMAHWMLSRALLRQGLGHEALEQSQEALQQVSEVSDEESYLIRAWAFHVGARVRPGEHLHGEGDATDAVDTGIAVYPRSADLYVLAGEMAPTSLQATPYYLAALQLRPDHPLSQGWKPRVSAIPVLHGSEVAKPALGNAPIRLYQGLGHSHAPLASANPQAQAYFDQGLCCLYGYVDNAARKSFVAALKLDPQSPLAWWALSFCPPPSATPAQLAHRAWQLARDHGNDAERRYCAIRCIQLQPRGSEAALDALGGALAARPTDVTLWMWRATFQGFAGESDDRRSLHGLPFALAAWRLAPDHSSANHELIHTYEAIDRPVLGWPYTWGFRRSAPHLPHAQHMQAHLAMRLGRWREALACTRESIRLSAAGFPEQDASHHLSIYFWALGHEGKFAEALRVSQKEVGDMSWPRLLRLRLDDERLAAWATRRRGRVGDGWYFGALADLGRGRARQAGEEFKHFAVNRLVNYSADTSLWADEVQARLWLQLHQPKKGLQKLQEVARWSDSLPESHRWGQGAYYDELWGEAALQNHDLPTAREAFQEALAHEHGSIVGALGLQIVAQRSHNQAQAAAFDRLARTIWQGADPGARERLLLRLRRIADGKAPIF